MKNAKIRSWLFYIIIVVFIGCIITLGIRLTPVIKNKIDEIRTQIAENKRKEAEEAKKREEEQKKEQEQQVKKHCAHFHDWYEGNTKGTFVGILLKDIRKENMDYPDSPVEASISGKILTSPDAIMKKIESINDFDDYFVTYKYDNNGCVYQVVFKRK